MLTRTGFAAVAAAGILLVAATAFGYVELAALAIACLLALGFALLWVQYRPPLEVERTVAPMRVTVGDPAEGVVEVHNVGTRPSLPLAAYDKVGKTTIGVPLPRLSPGATRTERYALPTGRRAVLDVGPLIVVRSDPFGLAKSEQARGEVVQVFVHPRRHALKPLPATFERSLEGPTSDSAPRGSQAFHQLREYVPGDDRRMIHWRTSARTDTLMVRQHVDTSLPDLTVVLDNRVSGFDPEAFEVAVEVVASLVTTCTEQGFPVRMRTTDGQRYEPPPGQSSTTYFLDRLAGIEQDGQGGLVALSQVLSTSGSGYALVAVTGRPSGDDVRSLTPLVRRFSSVALVDVEPDAAKTLSAPGVKVLPAPSSEVFADQWNLGWFR